MTNRISNNLAPLMIVGAVMGAAFWGTIHPGLNPLVFVAMPFALLIASVLWASRSMETEVDEALGELNHVVVNHQIRITQLEYDRGQERQRAAAVESVVLKLVPAFEELRSPKVVRSRTAASRKSEKSYKPMKKR